MAEYAPSPEREFLPMDRNEGLAPLNATDSALASKPRTAGLAIATLVLGLLAPFIPLVGALLGFIAIILGVVCLLHIRRTHEGGKKLAISGMVLGGVGIISTVLIYSVLFYWGLKAKTGPWAKMKPEVTRQVLTSDVGALELYKKRFGKFPQTLADASKAGFPISPMDSYMQPVYYRVSEDCQSYDIRSLGPDGKYGTSDDILPPH
jgi:hypothetical protein